MKLLQLLIARPTCQLKAQKEVNNQLTEGVEDPATAWEALEAAAPTLEVMDARPPVDEAPPPMVIPEEAEVKEAPAPPEDLLSCQHHRSNRDTCYSRSRSREGRSRDGRSILSTSLFKLTDELLSFLELTG